jgi:hypothetical protein
VKVPFNIGAHLRSAESQDRLQLRDEVGIANCMADATANAWRGKA